LALIAELLHKERMKFERGAMITIGISGWWGGWYQLATLLKYNNPDLFWVDGDVKALDKHIPDFMLYVYLSAGARYWAWDSFNKHQRVFLKRIYLLLEYHMVNKITLQPGELWRMIIGVMYSGGPETSHGDSWIMAVIFYTYIEFVILRYSEHEAVIRACLVARFIYIIVYGDDHIWCCPKRLRDIINAESFARFLKDIWGMELRDFREYEQLISEVDIATGVFRYKGPKFLKRYFIRSSDPGMAPIVPYKETLEPLLKMCIVSNHEGMPGLILKSIGQAWDSMGTNPLIYEGAKAAFQYASSVCTETPMDIFRRLKKSTSPVDRKLVKNMLRKCHMGEEEMFESFPSLQTLRGRHKFVPSQINNKDNPLVF
jgi:hypothetical protein